MGCGYFELMEHGFRITHEHNGVLSESSKHPVEFVVKEITLIRL